MPEASMYEDRSLAARHDDIGLARKVDTVQPVANAHLAKHPSHYEFGLSVLRSDRGHVPAALFGRVDVRHACTLRLTSAMNCSTLRISISPPLGYWRWISLGTTSVTFASCISASWFALMPC